MLWGNFFFRILAPWVFQPRRSQWMTEWICPALSFSSFARNLWPSHLVSGLPSPCQKSLGKAPVSVVCECRSLVFLSGSLCFNLFYPCATKASFLLKGTVSCSPRQRPCSVLRSSDCRGLWRWRQFRGSCQGCVFPSQCLFKALFLKSLNSNFRGKTSKMWINNIQSLYLFVQIFWQRFIYFLPDCTQSMKFLMYLINQVVIHIPEIHLYLKKNLLLDFFSLVDLKVWLIPH